MTRRALLSCWTKDDHLLRFARTLTAELNYELWASGGTSQFLQNHGLPVNSLEQITGFQEKAQGRVKTLHPGIFEGILHPDNPFFHLIVVDLYPFRDLWKRGQKTSHSDLTDLTEHIDIGGVALLRAGAKNWKHVLVVPHRSYFSEVLQHLITHQGESTPSFRQKMAYHTFSWTSLYDASIAFWLRTLLKSSAPPRWVVPLAGEITSPLRYGENPHQEGWLVGNLNDAGLTVLQGKPLSFNNLLDIFSGLRLLRMLVHSIQQMNQHRAVGIVIKHTQPCGVAVASSVEEALKKAWESDPESAFGGVLLISESATRNILEFLKDRFFEILCAPNFSDISLLPSRRICVQFDPEIWFAPVPNPVWQPFPLFPPDLFLLQHEDVHPLSPDTLEWKNISPGTDASTLQQWTFDFLIGDAVVRHLFSNAVAVVRKGHLLGIGSGQPSRVRAVRIALHTAREFHGSQALKEAVLVSDGFFPFPDSVELCAEAGIRAILTPGGSRKDDEVIQSARLHNIALAFSGIRRFRHF